jgi:hypothetical protein
MIGHELPTRLAHGLARIAERRSPAADDEMPKHVQPHGLQEHLALGNFIEEVHSQAP